MPNWCCNQVCLSHADEAVVQEFVSMMSTPETLFNTIRPRPTIVKDDDIMTWNNDNWGTKWEPNDFTHNVISPKDIEIYFDTAWSPPIGIYNALIEKGWVINALYSERESEFCGRFSNEHGDELYEYDGSDPSTFTHLPSEILEFTGLLDDQDDEYDDEDE